VSRRETVIQVPPCMGGRCWSRDRCQAYHAPFRGMPRDQNGEPLDVRICPEGADVPFPMGTTHIALRWEHRVPAIFRRVSDGCGAMVAPMVAGG